MPMQPIPPDIDLGHPMDKTLSRGAQNGILNLLGFAGGELGNISNSVRYDNRTIDGHPLDNGRDVNNIGLGLMNSFGGNPAPQPVQTPVRGLLPAAAPQQIQQQNQYMPMKKEKVSIEKYIGGSQAPQRPQAGGFAEALEPLDDKMEVMCQLLGRIYQSQNTLISLLRNLPQELSGMFSINPQDYLPIDTSNDPEPPSEEELYGAIPEQLPPPGDVDYGEDIEDEGLEEMEEVPEDEEIEVAPAPKKVTRKGGVKRKK